MKRGTPEWKEAISKAKKKTTCNEQFFETIDREAKAYYLGLFYADGHNNQKKGQIVINLKEEDRTLLERLKREIDYTGNVGTWIKKPPRQNQAVLAIVSRKLSDDIAKQGCPQQKTELLDYPYHIDKSLQRHFLRGFFDGDGSISRSKLHAVNFSIIAIEEVAIGIAKYMSEILGKAVQVENAGKGRYSINKLKFVRISNKKDIKAVLDNLYRDTDLYMQRKYDRYYNYFYVEMLADYKDRNYNK